MREHSQAARARPLPGRRGFQGRIYLHDQEMQACKAFLESQYGMTVSEIGQETMPGDWQSVAARIHGDATTRHLRYRPDLVAVNLAPPFTLMVEVKNRNDDSPNIAIERASFDEAKALRGQGLLVAYWLPGGRMAWPDQLRPIRDVSDPRELAANKQTGGSGTPYVLIREADVTSSAEQFITNLIGERTRRCLEP